MPAEESEISKSADPYVNEIAAALSALGHRRPRVHCLTNIVAAHFTANVLLAIGAIPSMTQSPEEVGAFVESADALLVNLGTLDNERREAAAIAVTVAREKGKPFVLDPVFIDRSPGRLRLAQEIVAQGPSILRVNGAEFAALSGAGADGMAVKQAAQRLLLTIAVSGREDIASDGDGLVRCANGHRLLEQVTAIGCAQAAIMAAFTAVCRDPLVAALGGLVVMGIAGEMAAGTARGPGSFAIHLIDALARIDAETVCSRARLA